jgi:hypothetical protein
MKKIAHKYARNVHFVLNRREGWIFTACRHELVRTNNHFEYASDGKQKRLFGI